MGRRLTPGTLWMILILSAGAAPLLPAEAPTPWVARLDRPAQWRPWPGAVLNHLVAVAPDGSTAVTGSPAYDYLTVVYDRDGAERWRAGFDGGTGSFDFPTALAVDSGGRVTVTGASYTEDFTRESWDIGTVQYAPDGSELWRAVYDGPGAQSDFPAAVAAGRDGEVIVAGTTHVSGSGFGALLVKYTPTGAIAWVAHPPAPLSSFAAASAVALDEEGMAHVALGAASTLVTAAYSPGGMELWATPHDFPTGGLVLARDLALDGAGNAFVLAEVAGDFATLKYQADGQELWARLRDGARRDDVPFAIALDGQGGVVVAGTSMGARSKNDFLAIRYAADGAELWTARHDGPAGGEDLLRGLAVDGGGNIYLSGESWREGRNADFTTLKYDSAGSLLWEATLDGGAGRADVPFGLALDGLGEPRVFGRAGTARGFEWATVAYDATGGERWVRRLPDGERAFETAQAVVAGESGGIFVAGTAGSEDIIAVQYGPDGAERWETRYDGPGRGSDHAAQARLDAGGNLLVLGTSAGSQGDNDLLLLKLDGEGDILWEARIRAAGLAEGERTHELATALALDASGAACLVGWTCPSEPYGDGCAILTAKVGPVGEILWVRRYTGVGLLQAIPRALAVDEEGNVYVAGMSRRQSAENGFNDNYLVLKYSVDGQELWARSFDGPGGRYGEAYAVAAAGGRVFVNGTSLGATTGGDATILAYGGDGSLLWEARHDGTSGMDIGGGLVVDGSERVIAAGLSWRRGSSFDLTAIAYESSGGKELWQIRYDGPSGGGERGPVLAIGEGGKVAVACSSFSGDASDDFATLLLSPQGEVEWSARWREEGPLPADERPNAIAMDAAGGVVVAGMADGDMIVVKYPALPPAPRFLRGDCNGDGTLLGLISEGVFLLNFNFLGGATPPCLAACDADGDGSVAGQVTDALHILNHAFLGGPPPAPPFPRCGSAVLASDAVLGCLEPPARCP